MKRPKGPQLKMPDLKPPGFLADFYYDLRDRRLLPVVALVLVAIVATPILLGQKTEAEVPPAAGGALGARSDSSGHRATLAVVEAEPGLRDYRKRLRHRTPLDPFRSLGKPNLEGARLGNGEGESGGEGESSGPTTVTSQSTTVKETKNSKTTTKTTKTTTTNGSGHGSIGGPSGGAVGPSGEQGGGGKGSGHAILYSFGIDVTIIHSSGAPGGERTVDPPEKRTEVLPTTPLPGSKKQVVTYMGLSPKTRKPLFLVSAEVTSVFGEGKCAAGYAQCQLIELEPGFPESFEYGEDGDRYSIKVTNVELVVTGHG